MTALTKKLTSLRGLIGSRYKSQYERISENQHKNLVGLAHELHNQDRERYKELKPFSNPKFDVKNGKKQLKDWIEIHDTTINFGSPELSDHTSGFSKDKFEKGLKRLLKKSLLICSLHVRVNVRG